MLKRNSISTITGGNERFGNFYERKKRRREKKGRRKEKLCKQVCFDFVSFNCEFRTINYVDIVDDKTFTFACG